MPSPMPGSTGQDRRRHRAGKAGQHGAEGEDDHEQLADIDAERRDHRRIRGAGPQQHADAGLIDDEPEPAADREPAAMIARRKIG